MSANANNLPSNQANKPELSCVLGTTQLPKGLVAIKALLGNKRLNPYFIYDNVLNEHQRAVLCFTAGLDRKDTLKCFNDLTKDQRLSIQKAVLMMDKIYHAFNKVNAISPGKFIANGYADSSYIKAID